MEGIRDEKKNLFNNDNSENESGEKSADQQWENIETFQHQFGDLHRFLAIAANSIIFVR